MIALTALSRSELTVVKLVALPTASIPLFFSSSTCLISLDLASGSKSVLLISASLSSAAFLIISIAEFLASCKSLVSLAFLSASKLIALIALTALSRSELTVVRLVALPTASIPLFFSSSTCLISRDLASGSKSVLLISASLSSATFLIISIA